MQPLEKCSYYAYLLDPLPWSIRVKSHKVNQFLTISAPSSRLKEKNQTYNLSHMLKIAKLRRKDNMDVGLQQNALDCMLGNPNIPCMLANLNLARRDAIL